MHMPEMFAKTPAIPYDPWPGVYTVCFPRYAMPLEYTGWQDESMAWKEACAISVNLYPLIPIGRFTGPDVVKLLSYATVSSYDKFPVGRLKHTALCDDEGRILTHGLVVRTGEEEFQTYALTPWLNYAAMVGRFNVTFEDLTTAEFNFQCTGPRSLELLEAATGDDLHDIPFMGHRMSAINGKEVRIFRVGMAGTLGYEVHGHIDHAQELHTKIMEVGQQYGIRRIGWLTYTAQLPEAGFPQEAYTFYTSSLQDQGYIEFLKHIGIDVEIWPGKPALSGSSGPDASRHFRNPIELGWRSSVSFNHDFRGKAALEKIAANPARKLVTLVWNADDIVDVYRSLFEKGDEPYRLMEYPIDPIFRTAKGSIRHYQDIVLKDGKEIGYSNGRVYSLHSRDMTSMGLLDIGQAGIGTEVKVLWGEPGTRQKEIRAVVSKFPHLDMPTNRDFDIDSIPRPNKSR